MPGKLRIDWLSRKSALKKAGLLNAKTKFGVSKELLLRRALIGTATMQPTLYGASMSQFRYKIIADELASRIARGIYPEGGLIPAETELMEEFDVSRHTMRSALAVLGSQGLISRKRGKGTVVEKQPSAGGFHQTLGALEDLIYLAAASPRTIRSIKEIVVDIELAELLAVPPGTRWLRISSTRDAEDGVPAVLVDVYVNKRFEGIKTLVRKQPERLISELVEEKYGCLLESVEQKVSAVSMPAPVAEVLGTAAEVPALRIIRRYRDHTNRIVSVSVSHHPGDRYQLSTVLVRRT